LFYKDAGKISLGKAEAGSKEGAYWVYVTDFEPVANAA
jgi:hypothetical protein